MSFDHIFNRLDITADPFALCELHGACNLGLGQDATTTLHYILSGHGELRMKGMAPIPISEGALVLVPAFHSHVIHSSGPTTSPTPSCSPAELELRHLVKTGETAEAGGHVTALCAQIRVGLAGAEDVIDLIRNPICEKIGPHSPLAPLMKMLVAELTAPTLGSKAMIRAMLTQSMIHLLRRRLQRQDDELKWMAALRDPSVWRALQTLLDRPEQPHTVETLAELVGMSRSAFANRFAHAYGSGPIELLRDIRIRRAGMLLRDTDMPVKSVAHKVGFASRTAFSRLFEKRTGLSPSDFRKETQG